MDDENNHENEDLDLVPEQFCTQLFLEFGNQRNTRPIQDFVAECLTRMTEERNEKTQRARAALRLGMAFLVHCTKVDRQEISSVLTTLASSSVKALGIDSETRFLSSGGKCTYAEAFPFAHLPDYLSHNSGLWRKSTCGVKRHRAHIFDSSNNSVRDGFARDLIIHVLSYCNPKSVTKASQVSREWNEAATVSSDAIWKNLFFKKWPDAQETADVGGAYKDRFKQRIIGPRSLKIPLGRRSSLPRPVFCEWCDKAFGSRSLVKKHRCQKYCENLD